MYTDNKADKDISFNDTIFLDLNNLSADVFDNETPNEVQKSKDKTVIVPGHDDSAKIIQNTQERCDMSSWGLPETILRKYEKRGVTNMFRWQAECLNNQKVLRDNCNLVYSAPTSAGKTLVAEILAIKTVIERDKKVIIILPFVSVVREKMFYFQDILSTSGVRVDGFMGSHNPPGGFKAVQLAVCTIEKANIIINRLMEEGSLDELGAIITDEMHLLGDPSRGYLLELLLTKVRYMCIKNENVNIQLIGMSATLPNLSLLSKWLDAELYTTDFRPIPLKEYYLADNKVYDNTLKLNRHLKALPELSEDTDHVLQLCLETINHSCSVLIFCPTKNWCENLAQQMSVAIWKLGKTDTQFGKCLREQLNSELISEILEQLQGCPVGLDGVLKKTVSFGVAFHHAGLTMDERDIIEGAFRNGALRILVATSTLSSGVNLPARRVIIRTPMFHGRPIDTLTYRQMIGRAGRMGRDTAGESILVCQKNNKHVAEELMSLELKPIESCLAGAGKLKRAILEVVASGVAASPDDIKVFTGCTLLAMTDSESPVDEAVQFLLNNEFIRLQINDGESQYVATSLAKACLASSLPPEDGLALFEELEKARQCFVLDTDLHLLYLVTPYSACNQWGDIDWMLFLNLWEKLPINMRRVADLIGIRESYIFNATRGKINTSTSKLYHRLQVHRRFFTALALQDLVNEVPLHVVASKFNCSRGMLQSLQQSSSTFAGMVTSFCHQLGWSALQILLSQFQDRLQFGIHHELVELMKLPLLNGPRARTLYNAGIESLTDLATCDVCKLENILYTSVPFQSEKERDGETSFDVEQKKKVRSIWITGKDGMTPHEAAVVMVEDARKYLQLEMGAAHVKWDSHAAKPNTDMESPNVDPHVKCGSHENNASMDMERPNIEPDVANCNAECDTNISIANQCTDNHNIIEEIQLTPLKKLQLTQSNMFDSVEALNVDSELNQINLSTDICDNTIDSIDVIDVKLVPSEPSHCHKNITEPNGTSNLYNKTITEIQSNAIDKYSFQFTESDFDCLGDVNDSILNKINLSPPDKIVEDDSFNIAWSQFSNNLSADCTSNTKLNANVSNASSNGLRNESKRFSNESLSRTNLNKYFIENESFDSNKVDDELNNGTCNLNNSLDISGYSSWNEKTDKNDSIKLGNSSFFDNAFNGSFSINISDNKADTSDIIDTTPTDNIKISKSRNASKIMNSKRKIVDGDDVNVTETPKKKKKYTPKENISPNMSDPKSDLSPVDLKSLDIIDVCGNKELFVKFCTELRGQTDISLAVACEYFKQDKPLIGQKIVHHTTKTQQTTGLIIDDKNITGFAISLGNNTVYYISLQNEKLILNTHKLNLIQSLFNNGQSNIKIFDCKQQCKTLMACGVTIGCRLEDPKIADWILQPEGKEKNLQAMALEYSPETVGLSRLGGRTSGTGSIAMNLNNTIASHVRASVEAVVTWHVVEAQKNKLVLQNPKLLNTFSVEMQSLICLMSMETVGLGVDSDKMNNLVETIKKHLTTLEQKAFSLAGRHFSMVSSKDVAKVLGLYKGKKVSTSKQVLEQTNHPISNLILQCRKLSCTLTKMLLPLIRSMKSNRIHGYCITHSATGRISMQDPNLQNVPRNFELVKPDGTTISLSVRSCFVPANNKIFVSADYCQLELRILAHLSQDCVLLRSFQCTEDVFVSIAAKLNCITANEVTDSLRQSAKQTCYGIIYGMGAKALSQQLGSTEIEAAKFIESFKNNYPSVKSYMEKNIELCKRNGFVETLAGRRRYLPHINEGNPALKSQAERQALNTVVQGSAADIAKKAMVLVNRELTSYAASLVLQLHDELLYEVDLNELKQVARIIKGTMESAVKLSVCLPVKLNCGLSWGELNSYQF